MAHDDLRLTLIGGPTVLLEWRGLRLPTDPTFDPRFCLWAGAPRSSENRRTRSPAALLPPIQGVLLSHDQHSDNLDTAGRVLVARAPRVVTTPAGARRLGCTAVGLATWESIELSAPDDTRAEVTATPARHGPAGIEPISGDVTGFLIRLASAEGSDFPAIYVSGDTVWYGGVAEVARRFLHVGVAILHLGAARLAARGDFNLTMSAADAISTARALPSAVIVPAHHEGWAHFSEGRSVVARAFTDTGLDRRITWLEAGVCSPIRPRPPGRRSEPTG
jgi:L-ascorbate metabolism protein UlaG (beta-lactamase superfamily)